MAMTFKFYGDAGLVTEAATVINQASSGATGAVEVPLWIGSTDTTKQIQADSNPGIDNLTVSVSDSAPASGQAASSASLALTYAGLASAIPGAPIDLGVTEILGGVSNAVPIWISVEASNLTDGTYTDLGLVIADAFQTTI